MATPNLNKMNIYNNEKNESPHCHCVKKYSCLMEQFYRHCSGIAIFLKKKINFML